MAGFFAGSYKQFEIYSKTAVNIHPAQDLEVENDIYVTDPHTVMRSNMKKLRSILLHGYERILLRNLQIGPGTAVVQ